MNTPTLDAPVQRPTTIPARTHRPVTEPTKGRAVDDVHGHYRTSESNDTMTYAVIVVGLAMLAALFAIPVLA